MDIFLGALRKISFSMSQYSGDLGPGPPLRYASHIPPFREPPIKTAGPPAQKKKAAAANTPAGRLLASQNIGKPRISAPPGPSIADISKPIGFGRKLPGATKTV